MSFFVSKRKRRIFIAVTTSLTLIAAIVIVCAVYVGDYYRADAAAIDAFAPMGELTVTEPEKGITVFGNTDAESGIIFYPGGKVEYTAYAPLMAACARGGVMCVLLEMPFNLAVLDINAADGIREMYPEVESWYIGGHSLGGSMAASYLAKHTDELDGLILLGSYSTADLSQSGVKVLSVYGSEDGVMNRVKYDENKKNLPEDFTETVIGGGNHAGFGMYGAQDGDGTPSITCEEQIYITASEILKLISGE